MTIKAYKVSKIVEYLKELLDEDMFLCSVLVEGEISNFRPTTAGHYFFSLVDEASALRCCMFKSDAQGLDFVPKNGDLVRIYGRVSLYEKSGDLQFYAELMEAVGDGKISQDLGALKARLEAEGVFGNSREIPRLPKKIAIITSPTGAAVYDIIDTVRRRNPLVQLIVLPTLVQGEQSPGDIANSIEIANSKNVADVLIVGRGGGSTEDLAAFNTEVVARAVWASQIPVISAVGHEIDYTLCDFAADERAATPTAAAELATPLTLEQMLGHLEYCVQGLAAAMEGRMRAAWGRLAGRARRLSPEHEIAKINLQWGMLKERQLGLGHAMSTKINGLKACLGSKIDILDKISPKAVLERGFVLATGSDGKLVQRGADLISGQKINLHFADVQREAEIT